ncbi:MAG: hypothetical protein IKN12_01430 [Selenomonadaceae bacterium]|nr:hypothetical protein [Selenomonadaceae bacterium]MBR3721403.1 hypothetical protein [Selenomonadaceae bacterium]
MARIFIANGATPTEEQRKNIRAAATKPVVYDEDCPKLTEEQLKKFKRVSKAQTVA